MDSDIALQIYSYDVTITLYGLSLFETMFLESAKQIRICPNRKLRNIFQSCQKQLHIEVHKGGKAVQSEKKSILGIMH